MLYPTNFEQKIGFDRIRGLLKGHCLSPSAEAAIDVLAFSSDYRTVADSLALVAEMKAVINEAEEALPLGSTADLRPQFARTRAEGTFLALDDVAAIRRNVEMVQLVISFITRRDEERFPKLRAQVEGVATFPLVLKQIDQILDKFGAVKDTASPELHNIRRAMLKLQGSVSHTLQSILRQAQNDGLVEKGATPSMREGRLVIPMPAMNKRALGGIVHDESATGKTVFIEPTAVVELNNRLRELQNDERREIIAILTAFTNFLRPHYEAILASTAFLIAIDVLQAKAHLALKIGAEVPTLLDTPLLDWSDARHPLLELSLKAQEKKIVPLTIRLDNEQRILLISGPNAGGKSVCLKTVGLLQYMLQTGLPIPLADNSRAGLFESLFIDIGDDQNIENDLSTYSSHLTNMKQCLRYGDERSLLLIDEFGSGTEPQIGGAMAEALLEQFNRNRAFGVITTHYTNLKHVASNTAGIVNGAMLYDRHNMQPFFTLDIGRPGSSFAVEIARKIGLPEAIIAAAADKVGSEHIEYDKNLQDAARDKRYWEKKRQQIREKERHAEQIATQYEEKMAQLKQEQRDMLRKAKADAAALVAGANARIEETIRTIKTQGAEKEPTKQARQALQSFAATLQEQEKKAKPTVQAAKPDEKLAVDDAVTIAGHAMVGKIISVSEKSAVVAFGQLQQTVALSRLERVGHKEQKRKHAGVSKATTSAMRERQLNFSQQIDLRGMRVDEALQAVMYYIDDAQIAGVAQVRILHGTGTGALRQAVRDYLQANSAVASFADEHVQFGGAGITVVAMK